jgi:hypothetical protein
MTAATGGLEGWRAVVRRRPAEPVAFRMTDRF